jgi:hypothetical protein
MKRYFKIATPKQGCQMVQHTKFGKNIPNGRKIYQNGENIPNGLKIYQMAGKIGTMAIKYTNILHCKTLPNLPKSGFLVTKNTIWQPGTNVVVISLKTLNSFST